ncbi:MAG: FtsX-like permease family protein [Pseudonocardiales bacterium]
MKAANALLLARPAAAVDRKHARLAATCLAIAGGLLLVATQLATTQLATTWPPDDTFAPFVAQDGLRPGVVIGTLLLTVPVLALTWQLLRVGSDARDRRMAALRLAGATPAQARTVAAVESARTSVLGGILAGPAYLLLWVALGVLPPAGARMVPDPRLTEIVSWLVLIVLIGASGAVAGAAVRQPLISEPLRGGQRTRSSGSRWATYLAVALGAATLAGFVAVVVFGLIPGPWYVGGMIFLLVATAMTLGTRIVTWLAGRLRARGTPVDVLAAALLKGAPGPTGRVAGVLWICGIGLGFATMVTVGILEERYDSSSLAFYLSGIALAVGAILVGMIVAAATLAVGMIERLHDARRAIASLAALGVDEAILHKVLRRQLTVPSIAAMASGVLAGGFYTFSYSYGVPKLLTLGAIALVVVGSVLVIHVVATVMALALRARLRDAMNPENLRTA